MVYLFFLLLVLPFSLALPQGEDRDRDLPMNVTVGATSVSPGSTTTPEKVTTTVLPPPEPTATEKGTLLEEATTTVSPSPKPTTKEEVIPLPVEVNYSDSWSVPTVDAWVKEEVDRKLKEWWELGLNRTSRNFVSEFGKAFEDFEHNLACGVGTEDQCINPSCEGLFIYYFSRSSWVLCSNCFLA